MMTDPIADMLARIRNAGMAHHPEIVLSVVEAQARDRAGARRREGFLGDVRVEARDGQAPCCVMRVRYDDDGRAADRRDAPRERARAAASTSASDEIPRVRSGLGVAVISTSKGVLSDREAREASVGGEAALRGLVAMSRIGRKPIAIPSGVTVETRTAEIRVKGPKGTLARAHAAAGSRSSVESGEVSLRAAPTSARPRARCTGSRAR